MYWGTGLGYEMKRYIWRSWNRYLDLDLILCLILICDSVDDFTKFVMEYGV